MLAQIVLPKGRISGQQSVCQRRRAAGNRILSNLRKMRPLSLPLPACRTCALAAAVRAPHATLGSGRPLGLNSCQLPRPQHPNFVLKFWENAEKNPQILSHLCNRCSLSTPATQVHSLEQPDAILNSGRGHGYDSRQLPTGGQEFMVSKVKCMFSSGNCTTEGRGGGSANFQKLQTEPLTP